jgi:hypothetical protein
MRTSLRLVPFIIILIFSWQMLCAQWIPVQGMDGADVTDIETIDSIAFIKFSGTGVHARNIYSGSWHQVLSTPVVSLEKAGNYLFGLYVWGSAIYRTSDLGQSWDEISLPTGIFAYHMVTIAPLLYISTYDDILRSDDYGDSWYSVKNNIPSLDYCKLFANGSTLIIVNDYPFKIYISGNYGMHWDTLSTAGLGTDAWYLKDIYKYQSEMWASLYPGIFKYDEVQENWEIVNDTLSFSNFGEYMGSLYGCGKGMYQLDANGNTWIPRNDRLDASDVFAMASMDTAFFCGTNRGPYRTSDSLAWQPYYDGLHGGGISSISCNESEIWVCSWLGVYKSVDNGTSFLRKSYPGIKPFGKIIITDSLFFAINDDFYISYDHGESWIKQTEGLPTGYSARDIALGNEYIFLLYNGNFYRSNYSAVNWELLPIASSPIYSYLVAHDSTLLFANSSYAQFPVTISHDNGNTTEPVTVLQSGGYPYIKYDHNKLFIGECDPIYFSFDDGYTWDDIPMTINEFNGTDCSENDEALVAIGYMYEFSPLVYITYDQGTNWIDVADNLTDCGSTTFTNVQINGNRILLGSQANGLWYRDNLITGMKQVPREENDFLKVFPNPAYDRLFVTFNLPEESEGRIVIHDLFGIPRYDSGIRPYQKGSYCEIVDVRSLPNGVYIISLLIDGQSFCQKFCRSTIR